jgi:hypothetical protein
MPTQQQQIAAGFGRVLAAVNALDAKSAAALAAAIAALPQSLQIDDAATANNKVWSSNKTQAQITAAINALINGAGVDSDSLKELADQITALAQADNGLISAVAIQAFSDAQKQRACANIGIGNPLWDYVPAIEAGLNPGL